jgi:hypothetical protein
VQSLVLLILLVVLAGHIEVLEASEYQ